MSIFFNFDVGPNGRRFRRAVDADKHEIATFWNRQYTDTLFGEVDIPTLIELSPLSICMINEKLEVTGFIVLGDHPNLPGVDPSDWEVWIRNMYQKYYLSRYTLFVHFMCFKDEVSDIFMEEAYISIFRNDPYLLQIVMLVSPCCPQDVIQRYTMKKRNMFKYSSKRNDDDSGNLHYLFVGLRQDFYPRLKMRRAVEEDNDDIVEILDKKSPKLRELYGDYYISEILGRHPDSKRKIIVAEYLDRAVGVMCLNAVVNYKKLQKKYELKSYYGLMKATSLEKEKQKRSNSLVATFGEPITFGKWSPFYRSTKYEENPVEEEVTEMPASDRKKHSVNFEQLAARRRSLVQSIYSRKQSSDDFSEREIILSPTPSQTTDYSVVGLLDEDPFDYEIVNIDNNLLSIPEALSRHDFFQTKTSIQTGTESVGPKKKRKDSLYQPKKIKAQDHIVYEGAPNAFSIELFGLRDDMDENRSMDLLEAAFEVMKNYDYCIMQVPCLEKTFPLLQHFCYVPMKPHVSSKYALFIAHRSSVFGKLRVRLAEWIDIPQMALLLNNLEGKETIWTVENSINQKDNQTYVFMSDRAVVGIGVLEPPEQIGFLRAKYNLDPYHIHKYHHTGNDFNCGFSAIKTVLVNSVFEQHFRFFMRDMMRISGSDVFVWLTAYRNKWAAHKANSFASVMIPLLPRKSVVECSNIPEMRRIINFSRDIMPFSVWFMGKKLTSIPKIEINTRIMVVGASRTAMAFLNTLLFSDASSYLTFTNVTLITPSGLPYVRKTKKHAEMMFPQYHTHTEKYLKSVPYTYYVNIVQGTMVALNKKDRYITLANGSNYYYDLLFLLFGKQYQHPDYLKEVWKKEIRIARGDIPPYIRLDVPKKKEELALVEETPDNVFIVNTMSDANRALGYIRNNISPDFYFQIVVYGASIHAYCCIATLLEMDIPAENIVFVEPFPPENPRKTRIPVFTNVNVDKTVQEVMKSLGVIVHRGYYFQSWIVEFDNTVNQVEFLSDFHMLRLECSVFFYYGKRGVNAQAFSAICDSGMAYDGGILIDHQFRTKDPWIYAAGPGTRYHRRYFADTKRQKYYDSYEIGEKLGKQIRNQLDPLFMEKPCTCQRSKHFTKNVSFDDESLKTNDSGEHSKDISMDSQESQKSEDNIERLPVFKKPIVIHCQLPGGLQYLEVKSPGMKIPHPYLQTLHYNGVIMETFKGGYFKLHFTSEFVVDGITCLTPSKCSLENFKNIYGLSAVVLNNVHLRYSAKKIDNFYEFFRLPWAFYLYHDQADELFAMAKNLLPKGHSAGDTLGQALHVVGEKISNPSFRFNTKLKIRNKFEKSPHIEAIADYVIEWLSENDMLLPVYLQPGHSVKFTHDLERHPAFRRRRRSVRNLIKMIY